MPHPHRTDPFFRETIRVYLVGAGPGDPGLLTRKGAGILERADVVLYDHLIPLDLLDLAPPHAERIDVGKVRNHPRMTQAEIESTLIDRARAGKIVVRLKGGDPFVFGRGGEEAQALKAAGIPFALVPGVSSPIAVPAYAGVPVTHRECNSRLVILTAHDDPSLWSDADVLSLTRPHQTLVVLMGVLYMKGLVERLLSGGLSPHTPVLLTRWGTTSRQESFQETLGTLPSFLDRTKLLPPVTLVIGDVVKLRPEVEWVHRLPLFRKRILLTREPDRSGELASILGNLGATVISCPTVSVSPRLSPTATEAIAHPEKYSWILFLSPNGVRFFFQEFRKQKKDLRSLFGIRIFSMGPATTEALERLGLIPDLIAVESHGPGVLETFSSPGQKVSSKEPVLVVRGDRGTGLIPEGLARLGFPVDVIGVYQNALPDIPSYKKVRLEEMFREGSIDLVLYYSPSSFTGLMHLFPGHEEEILSLPSLAIGPTTREELSAKGVRHIVMASRPTLEGVIGTALDFLRAFGNNAEVNLSGIPGQDAGSPET